MSVDVFETVLGVPAHPLLIHAAVVFVPLLIIGAVGYAVLPRFRARINWAVAALAVVAPLSALLAKLSGDALRARMARLRLASPQMLDKIDEHRGYGTITLYLTIALGVVALIMVLVPAARRRPIDPVLWIVLTVGLGIATGYYVFRTGDTGAHAVWNGY